MQGKYKNYKEILIHDDFRIIYRIEDNSMLIRFTGAHYYLKTG